MKTWFITGVSRGLGRAIAEAALATGDRVIGTVRGDTPSIAAGEPQLHLLKADLFDPESTTAAVHKGFELAGKVDVIVNNAGFGVFGSVEGSTDDELAKLFDINVFAPIRVVRTALPYLRAQGSGHIINITSIAGRAPSVGATLYSASKHAIEGFSTSLALEVSPLGIKVTAVAPGQFRTDFLTKGDIHSSRKEDSAYSESVGKAMSTLVAGISRQPGDPVRAARVIVEIANADEPPVHLLLGSDALKRTRIKVQSVLNEIETWERATLSTDFE